MNIHLLETAIQTSLRAGIEIMKVYESDDFGIETKEDLSPVTRADIAASTIITADLQKTNIPVICEETTLAPYSERKTWKQVWIVDPIDGTKDFIAKNNEFTVNIALIENQEPIIGVIYVPVDDTLYFSLKGFGAFVVHNFSANTTEFTLAHIQKYAIQLPYITETSEFNIVASRSHRSADTSAYIETVQKTYPHAQILNIGSSLKFCVVATGRAQLYPRFENLSEWDVAAGDAIVRAAGYNARNAHTHETLVYNKEDLMQPHFIIS